MRSNVFYCNFAYFYAVFSNCYAITATINLLLLTIINYTISLGRSLRQQIGNTDNNNAAAAVAAWLI